MARGHEESAVGLALGDVGEGRVAGGGVDDAHDEPEACGLVLGEQRAEVGLQVAEDGWVGAHQVGRQGRHRVAVRPGALHLEEVLLVAVVETVRAQRRASRFDRGGALEHVEEDHVFGHGGDHVDAAPLGVVEGQHHGHRRARDVHHVGVHHQLLVAFLVREVCHHDLRVRHGVYFADDYAHFCLLLLPFRCLQVAAFTSRRANGWAK